MDYWKQLVAYTEKMYQDEHTVAFSGAYTGEASIAMAYLLLYQKHKTNLLRELIRKQCFTAYRMSFYDETHDVLGGNAGAILVFLAAYEMTQELGRRYGETIISRRTEICMGTGMGASGYQNSVDRIRSWSQWNHAGVCEDMVLYKARGISAGSPRCIQL